MTRGIARRRDAHETALRRAQQLDPKPGAKQLIDELAQLEALKEAGVLSEAQYSRQRALIFSGLV